MASRSVLTSCRIDSLQINYQWQAFVVLPGLRPGLSNMSQRSCLLFLTIAGFLLSASLFGMQAETQTFRVLLPPSLEEAARRSIAAGDLTASIGENRFTVLKTQLLGQGVGRTVVVLDFASTSPTNHACLLAEASVAIKKLRDTPSPLVIAAGEARFLQVVKTGHGGVFQVYGGEDLSAIEQNCAASRLRPRPSFHSTFNEYASTTTLRSLLSSFESNEYPVRIFWISERFRWFDTRGEIGCVGEDAFRDMFP